LVYIGNCLFYGILTWYFDHVVSSNRGKDESPLFLFSKNYILNCCKKRRNANLNGNFKKFNGKPAIDTKDSKKHEK